MAMLTDDKTDKDGNCRAVKVWLNPELYAVLCFRSTETKIRAEDIARRAIFEYLSKPVSDPIGHKA